MRAVPVGAGIGPGQRCELCDPQTRCDHDQQDRVVTPTGPGGPIGSGQQCLDFRLGEVGHLCLMGVLGGYSQDPGDELGVLKVTQGGMVEQGMDSRQACIAGSGAVASLLFEHGEKAGDVLGTCLLYTSDAADEED